MSRTFGTFKDRMRNLVYIFAPGLYNASQKTKVILSICIAAVIIIPVIFAVRFFFSDRARPTGFPVQLETLSVKDPQGNQWTMELLPGQPQFYYSPSKVKTGPPLLISPDVEIRGKEVLIGLEVKGQAKEKYTGVVMRNGVEVEPPRFDILDLGGKVLASSQFKYG